MLRIYNHPIRFLAGTDLEGQVSDPESDRLPVRPGDFLRTLVPRRELAGYPPQKLEIVLLPNDRELTVGLDQRSPVAAVGSLRPQACERYTYFRLKVNRFRAGEYTQFVLLADGQPLMDPFGATCDTLAELMQALKDHFEAYPYAHVKAHINGSLLDVYMRHNDQFRLFSELTVGLGRVEATNENNPQLTVRLLSSGNVQPAFRRYTMQVAGTLVEGNQFSFDNRTYTVRKGDTARQVIDFFTATGKVDMEEGQSFALRFEAGSRKVSNVGLPVVYATREQSGTPDRYRVHVVQFEPGNIISLATTGKSLSYTVKASDTIQSIEDALNPNGGYFDVPQNDQLTIRTLPGHQVLANDNRVEFILVDPEYFPEQTYNLYGVTIGSDVVKGNIFRLGEQTVVAGSGDTSLSIGQALSGRSTNYFTVRHEGELTGWAEVGGKYTEEDQTDVVVWQQPFVEESPFVVAEMLFSENIFSSGEYALALRHRPTGEIVAIGPAIGVGDNPYTSLLEVADQKQAFGFHYGEPGLTQRLRLPLLLRTETPEITENQGKMLDGRPYTLNVRVDYLAPFSTTYLHMNTAKSLVTLLKHQTVLIDGQAVKAEAVQLHVLSEHGRIAQVAGTVRLLDQARDNHQRLLFPQVFGSGHAVIQAGYLFGLQLLISDTNFTREIQEGQNIVPVGGYVLEATGIAFGGNDYLRVRVRDEEGVLAEITVDRTGRYKSPSFRVRPGQILTVDVAHTAAPASTDYEPAGTPTEDYTAETSAIPAASFGSDFNNDFNRS